jgi:DNA-binding CsgD family transcriptional regulator
MDGTIVLDTNVFTARLRPRSPLSGLYDKHILGRCIAAAAQTVAEARFGGLAAGWGPQRMAHSERLVHRCLILPTDDETVWTFARTRAECRRRGHPLHQKDHVGDAYGLTSREREVVRLLALGHSRGEIAKALVLSAHTVDDHVKRAFAKVQVRSRAELTAKLFLDQNLTRMNADVPVGGTGWFLR